MIIAVSGITLVMIEILTSTTVDSCENDSIMDHCYINETQHIFQPGTSLSYH